MENEKGAPSVGEALAELAGIEGQMNVTGAVDVEPEQLNALREKLLSGQITPTEAVASARAILSRRQDYH